MTLLSIDHNERSLSLLSPTKMPHASAFLWNSQMMIQMSCRGYATAQFMQPEPTKYAHAPNIEATSFMQPEQPYYAHHPGRFFYIKDNKSGELFSAPYEPVRKPLDRFIFTAGQHQIKWSVVKNDIQVDLTLSLSKDHPAELWSAAVTNLSSNKRSLSLTPYFPVGYMSWMNQSAVYDEELQSIICRSITPYQKYNDYFKNKNFKDLTYLLCNTTPESWETRQSAFEGEGGLHSPTSLLEKQLSNSEATYETPTAAVQYQLNLNPKESRCLKFVFGPAQNRQEIKQLQKNFFATSSSFDTAIGEYAKYISQANNPITIQTPDKELDNFVNHWLSRQVFYHGDVNRLCTDPQTRNYLQDTMGMSYIKPKIARKAFLTALSQQNSSGAMPDGILLHKDAELKYINQVPHMDHCVWVPICLRAYLDETADYEILDEEISYADTNTKEPVSIHIDRALRWLFQQRNEQGLNFINEGDWCDPMNMVGYKGQGVSIWLTLANAYANNTWSNICQEHNRSTQAVEFLNNANECNKSVNEHGWDGQWYARGITDDGVTFGTKHDKEGQVFLNPQSWAILSGASNIEKQLLLINAIAEKLESPYGVEMLSPAFTKMRDDIGRVTQKHPGTAENGSIYNHASAFYIYALYQVNDQDRAFRLLRQMIPGPNENDLIQRGQLPAFIPNYYRGAVKSLPRTAGRSSQLFNTGTVHWIYRCLIEGLFGIKGCKEGLQIAPQLPSQWNEVSLERRFRAAIFKVTIKRDNSINKIKLKIDDVMQEKLTITNIEPNTTYQVNVLIPPSLK